VQEYLSNVYQGSGLLRYSLPFGVLRLGREDDLLEEERLAGIETISGVEKEDCEDILHVLTCICVCLVGNGGSG
jgi:hypothetical protein